MKLKEISLTTGDSNQFSALTEEEKWVFECLQLAERGRGLVSPNPLVGAVVTRAGEVISTGYHSKYGVAHAEVAALENLPSEIPPEELTLYVNLEPCSHHGKTPPCADLIIQKRIGRTIFGMIDPNPLVSGQGRDRLRAAGLQAEESSLSELCAFFNRRFICQHNNKRPYIILKWAQTADRFIARADGSSKWISCEKSRELTHRWRSNEDSILIGTNTAMIDNPQLTVRMTEGRNPLRLAIDRFRKIPSAHALFDQSAKTVLYTEKLTEHTVPLTVLEVPLDFSLSVIDQVLSDLFQRGVQSLIVEGGTKTLCSFLSADLWDEARVFTARSLFGSGVQAPVMKGRSPFTEREVGSDTLSLYLREHPLRKNTPVSIPEWMLWEDQTLMP